MEREKEMLYRCIRKKATGYESVETQDEYSLVEGELTLTKRKVTTKEVPPDLTAVRFLLSESEEPIDLAALERERKELIREYAALFRSDRDESQAEQTDGDGADRASGGIEARASPVRGGQDTSTEVAGENRVAGKPCE